MLSSARTGGDKEISASVPLPAPAFCEAGKDRWRRAPGPMIASLCLHLSILVALMLWKHDNQWKDRQPVHKKAPPVHLVLAPKRELPAKPTRPQPQRAPILKSPETPAPLEKHVMNAKAKIHIDVDFDPSQQLPQIIAHWNGSVGFGDGSTITYQFEAPEWQQVPLEDYGRNLSAFYSLLIDESHGSYQFLDAIRAKPQYSFHGLKPYALFNWAFQARLQEVVLTAVSSPCAGEIQAVVRLDVAKDLEVLRSSCIPDQEPSSNSQ